MIIGIFTHFFAVVTTLAERQFFRALAKLIGRRAARLSACGIAAIVGKMGYLDEGCSVGADGSLYNVRNPTFFWLSMNLTTLIYVNLNHYLEIWVVDLLVFGHSFTPLNSSTSPCYPFLPLLTRKSSTLVRLCGLCECQKYPGFADRIHEGLVDIFGDKGRCASYQSSLSISPFLPHSHFIWSCRPVGYEKAGRSMSGLALFFFCCLESWLDLSYWWTYFQYCRNIVTHHAEDGSGVGSAIIAGERLLLLYAFLSP